MSVRKRLRPAAIALATVVASGLAGTVGPAAAPLCAPASAGTADLDARLEGRGCAHVEAQGPDGRERLVADALGPASWSWPRLVEADVVLLGEVHDNPGHHRRRAALLRELIQARGGLPARRSSASLVMEQLRAEQRAGLDAFYAGTTRTSAELFRLVEWENSGWPPQALYAPLIDAALELSLVIRAGDPSRALVRAVARQGLGAMAADEREALGLMAPLEPELAAALDAELADSHCGALPSSALAGMAAAQRLRDGNLARVVADEAAARGSAFLVAGNGHVRRDRGVPWYLMRRDPRLRIATVMLVEVAEGAEDAAPVLPRDPMGRLAADLVLLTARVTRPDPCAAMTEKMKRKSSP